MLASKTTKEEAINILDGAIAYINEHGYNIRSYGEGGVAACYIGSVQLASKCSTIEEDLGNPESQSNPAVTTALNVLDHLAAPLMSIKWISANWGWSYYKSRTSGRPGRTIEAYGFQCEKNNDKDEKEEVLNMLRKAKEVLSSELNEDDIIMSVIPPEEEQKEEKELVHAY